MRILTALVACAAMAACTAPVVAPAPVATDPIKTSLAQDLLEIESMPRHSATADAKAAPAKLAGGRITIRNYVGDAANLLTRIAKARNMQFLVNGPEPRLPLLVTVDVESVSFEEFLSQVGFQFGQRANLVLGDQKIEIRYRGQP